MARERTVTVTKTITLEVDVTCTVSPAFSGRGERGLSLGEPPEPAHATIASITSQLGAALNIVDELDAEDRKAIEAAAIEAASDDAEADREAADEALADARREERLLGGGSQYEDD